MRRVDWLFAAAMMVALTVGLVLVLTWKDATHDMRREDPAYGR